MKFAFPRSVAALLALAALGTLSAMPAAHAEDAWPNKPIMLVSPYAPGGTTDGLARLLSTRLGEKIGQPIVVENRPGAGGNIGTAYVAKAKPDGYTFLLAASGPIVIAGALYPKLNYNPAKDFTAV